eukprot:TRINITY_DN2388_c0_g1_i4.p2 TRINITY_DN2388_c0_g1~~TRINITY_DN2388_c0_g1_i4.p2  ORF type:complete len:134 (-),score=51.97 TRINITY_DN2388_c0_g1_i4:138-539(-)
MELYVKAGEDGVCVGDCPFAQYCTMIIALKQLRCTVIPCTAHTKPSWLLEQHAGAMPCLLQEGGSTEEAITESSAIAHVLNAHQEPLLDPSTPEADAAVEGLFPAIAKMIKNKDEAAAEELRAALLQLSLIHI